MSTLTRQTGTQWFDVEIGGINFFTFDIRERKYSWNDRKTRIDAAVVIYARFPKWCAAYVPLNEVLLRLGVLGIDPTEVIKVAKREGMGSMKFFETEWHTMKVEEDEEDGWSVGIEETGEADIIAAAWRKTMSKWELIIKGLEIAEEEGATTASIYDGGQSSCGLCDLYWKSGCEECPIALDVGRRQCRGTPIEYLEQCGEYGRDIESLLLMARKEYELLKRIMANEEPKDT